MVNAARNAWGEHLSGSTPRHGVTTFHEILHIFGLLHPHQGYAARGQLTKRDICRSPCIETSPAGGRGDFCEDTPPTPENRGCGEPTPCSQGSGG